MIGEKQKTVEMLRKKGLMTELGEKAVGNAKNNGMRNAPKDKTITDDQIKSFTENWLVCRPHMKISIKCHHLSKKHTQGDTLLIKAMRHNKGILKKS